MALSSEISIERIALGMIDRTLPRRDWTHAGHFAAALWLSRHRPGLTGAEEMRTLISRYNDATDTANTDTGGYHHTITRASVRAAAAHLAGHRADAPIHVVLTALMASEHGSPNWLFSHWSRRTLFSVSARRDWIEPDVAPLPF